MRGWGLGGLYSESRTPYRVYNQGGGLGAIAAVGVMAGKAIPGFNKVRDQSREAAIRNNLRQLANAADQHMLEHGVEEVRYDQIVGPEPEKYIKAIEPVAGESYEDIVIRVDTPEISVTTPDGLVVVLAL